MVDKVSRSAAWIAALVAVPVGLVAGLIAFLLLSDALNPDATGPDEPPPGPVATGPVTLPERALTEREETVCRALLSQLPDQVRDLPQRPVTAGAEQNAAYGDPPITVECGVPEAEVAPTDTVWPLDGVCWHADEEGRQWVTIDREVPVRVTVPDTYDGPGQWAAEFSDSIVSTIMSAEEIPSGCR